jgi:hypothetical protein
MLLAGLLLSLCALILIGTPIAVAIGVVAIATMYWVAGFDLLFIFRCSPFPSSSSPATS